MNHKENLSAWMDNELNEQDDPMAVELPRQLLNSAEMRQFYSESILIGDALRSAETLRVRSVADKIAARLAQEPIHFHRPSSLSASRADKPKGSRQILVGAVAAAAVAFVALVAVAPQMQGGGVAEMIAGVSSGLTGTPSAPTMLSVQSATPVMLEDPRLRELLEAHGSMSIRPVSAEVR